MKFRFGVAHTEQEMSTMIQTSVFYVDNTGPCSHILTYCISPFHVAVAQQLKTQ